MSLKQRIDQTKRYYKRNGLVKTAAAVAERTLVKDNPEFAFKEVPGEELAKQRETGTDNGPKISVLVPAFETKEKYFIELIDCMLRQTYTNWELVIADASAGNRLSGLVIEDERIRYVKLSSNRGISNNTNEALKVATGDYIGLLDHDDVLTFDCLYHVAKAIVKSHPAFIYTDEDKGDEKMYTFFEPNRKKNFNFDLLLSNNYICHFLVLRADLMKELKLRPQYDGSQDYDLILRAADYAITNKEDVVHIPKILYHWRSYDESTSINTDSKSYAYSNGRKALEDYLKTKGWEVVVNDTAHLGFYQIYYYPDIFANRPEVGAVAGPIYTLGRISGGAMKADGTLYYKNLPVGYSGYLHRASLQQQIPVGDVRNMKVRPELQETFDIVVGDPKKLNAQDAIEKSIAFCERIRMMGYIVVYEPSMKKK
ncbi:MAG: glycosyltransferase [Lachnospiraceae bacterium]|nr:glycosyltransferase [Lachnospiraceae bacterium]